MPHPSWNDRYASGEPLPWDTGTPDPMLVEMIESRIIVLDAHWRSAAAPARTQSTWRSRASMFVGVDISPIAIEKARANARGCCRFEALDFPE
jgi:hypothetical protein